MAAIDDLARFRLLASAIAGRDLSVTHAAEGEEASTDGRTVFLGAAGDVTTHRRELALHAALVGGGSLDPESMRRLLGRPAVARRYLLLEGHRTLAELRGDLPGLATLALAGVDPPAVPSANAAESLTRALGRERLPDPPAQWGTLRPRRVLAAVDHGTGSAPTRGDLVKGARPSPLSDLGDDEETHAPGALAELFSNPVGARGPVARLLHKLLGLGREEGTGPAGAELPTGSARATNRAGPHAVVSPVPLRVEPVAVDREPGTARYPEWDQRRTRYKPEWCTVAEVDPPPEARRALPPVRDDRLLRVLARLGIGLEPVRRERQGDDLDLDALVDFEVDRRAGATRAAGTPRVYVDHLRRRRDLGVLVLLDASGSASERTATGEAVHEHQRFAAAALVDALSALGDRVAAYGFRSRGRAAVRLVRIKGFDDPFDTLALERLGGIEPGAFTRFGAAVRHATHLLETHAGTPRRLLVVLSDGFAYDEGYEGPYGEADARRALAEARERGIGCLCLSIGAVTDPAALRRVFGSAAYASAPRFDDLRDSLGVLFRRALTPTRTATPRWRA